MGGICSSNGGPGLISERAPEQRNFPQIYYLMEAAASGNIALFNSLLSNGANMHARDRNGRSALHLAAAEGRLEMVNLLIQNRAVVCVRDRWGHDPLQEAFLNGHTQVVATLLQAGATISQDLMMEMEAKLLNFVAAGNMAGVRNLLESGVSVNSTDCVGTTSIQIAIQGGNQELAQYLSAHGADIVLPNCL